MVVTKTEVYIVEVKESIQLFHAGTATLSLTVFQYKIHVFTTTNYITHVSQ